MALPPFALSPALSASLSVPKAFDQTVIRQSEHFQYQPTIWNYDHVESSLGRSSFMGEAYTNKTAMLIGDVRVMLEKPVGSLAQFRVD
ncbi:hypothetical protein FRX31_031749 [Thalictrum thalictroides]|uniref:Uncharacterized protein n=1 Tax=Thalictrum thalictroides TaxID=46969 RepID=A0A7J6V1G5_THATH|nr:hypothetical protein FRX31_031749 [Thalictrum thalictroides]